MKKKNLFVVNTYFQLITVINMAMTSFQNDFNSLIITDCSVHMDLKEEPLKQSGLFEQVFYLECKDYIYAKSKLKKYFLYLFQRQKILQHKINEAYDELFFFNYNVLTYSLFDELYSNNKKVTCSRFDEGFSSYTIHHKNNWMNQIIRKVLFRPNISRSVKKYYLYHPELLCYPCSYQLVKIDNINKQNQELIRIYNTVFQYQAKPIREKYIFFEESFFCDKKGIEDLDLILNIADIVGKENLLVKLHPRNQVNRFEKYGIKTSKDVGVPWEIIQMNQDFSDKVFLTISSGSVLASKLYFNETISSYFLYYCTDKMSDMVTETFLKYLAKLEKNVGLDGFCIPKNREEFYQFLKEDDENK